MIAEAAALKTIELALLAARDYLKDIVVRKNSQTLAAKRQAAEKKHMSPDELAKLTLNRNETATAGIDVVPIENFEILKAHLNSVKQWSNSLGFSDLKGTKAVSSIYVHLDTYLTPSRLHFSPQERDQTKPLEDAVFGWERHCIILGQPGAGKTTSMKRLCTLLLEDRKRDDGYTFPLLLRFRDLKDSHKPDMLLNELTKIFPLQFEFGGAFGELNTLKEVSEYKRAVFKRFIDGMNPVIILDGFDEYPDNVGKEDVVNEIRSLAFDFTKAKLIMTCRVGEFNYNIQNTQTFEIASLKREQIQMFAKSLTRNHAALL